MSEIDFSKLSLEDISKDGKPLVDPQPDPNPAPPSDPAPADPAPADPAPADPAPADPTPADPPPADPEPVNKADDPASDPVPPTPAPAPEYKFKDEFIQKLVEYYEQTGDITPYLQAKTVDFTAMSDEDIMRRNLREQYPSLSDKAFESIYKEQVVNKYKLDADEFSADDVEIGQELLKFEADKLRQTYIDWQKGFQAPEPVAQTQVEDPQDTEAMQKFQEEVLNNPITKQITTSKMLAVTVGDSQFNFEVPNTEALVEMTLDNNKFFAQFANAEGKIDWAKWNKVVVYSQNPELYESTLVGHGKGLGREEVLKEIKNPSQPLGGDPPTQDTGDFTSGLLQAFANRGVKK
jgi:hypothetical protein